MDAVLVTLLLKKTSMKPPTYSQLEAALPQVKRVSVLAILCLARLALDVLAISRLLWKKYHFSHRVYLN